MEKTRNPVKSSKGGPPFSHVFFADDLLLFAKADHENCSTIKGVLEEFCNRSGQRVSEFKSRVYFSPSVDTDSREALCDVLGFQSTSNLGKYLGIPIKHPGTTSLDFNFVLNKVSQKLAGWKANLLSMAGRMVLIQSSLSTIPAYVMQCAHLPGKILDGIDLINNFFLWGSTETTKKIHWVGWDIITKPKIEDGLGIQTAKGRNLALLVKLNWRFHSKVESLWARVLKRKYCTPDQLRRK